MEDRRLQAFQATVHTATLHQRSETSSSIIYSVPLHKTQYFETKQQIFCHEKKT